MLDDPAYYTRPLANRVAQLERILRDSPCYLIVRRSEHVYELVGQGDRIMALEVKRLRNALEQIASGKITAAEAAVFADAALDP